MVVGIGINVNWPADDADLPSDLVGTAGSLRMQVGHVVEVTEVLDALLAALEPRVRELGTASGRAGQAEELRSRCSTIGQAVRVELADGWFEGTATDLTPGGHLVVRTPDGPRTVLAGDVVHVRARSGGRPAPGRPSGRL